ncbi:MAG: T9SS type A sorting domain-containing protein [Bacteroidetes bacterium]|nr:T9SS type A sorting domain-containing protein [Bacteroidota bacterium]
MKTQLLLAVSMLSVLFLDGQTLYMTFTASGAANTVDSVKATNLRTNENVTLPGSDTLVLNVNDGISDPGKTNQNGSIFPNPFSGRTSFVTNLPEAQDVAVDVYNLAGQKIAHTQAWARAGSARFELFLSKTGVYMVNLTSSRGRSGFKAVCTETSAGADRVIYLGAGTASASTALKGIKIYNLGYKIGDVLLYRCRGGNYITIITDSPTASKKYTVEFVLCRDSDGKNYAVVKIGNQTWMAENLAWLPSVKPSSKGSDSLKFYYVYGYEDSIVAASKNTENYKRYGVLYNWPAAMNAPGKKLQSGNSAQDVCPSGWHLPYDEDWKLLETTLGMDQHEADSVFLRNSGEVGKKLKATLGWSNDTNCSNSSGFTVLPGGYRNTHGSFQSLLRNALYWTATQIDTLAIYRSINDEDQGVYRFTTFKSHGLSVRCIKHTY